MSFSERELRAIERQFEDGLTSLQILALFGARGTRLSEASFRKYVQLGLLPRSRRVGRKGLHRGSCGLYPATTVRRLHAVREMMARGHSLEEIERAFLGFQGEVEGLEDGLRDLLVGLERELRAPRFDLSRRRELSRELLQVKRSASELVRRIAGIGRELSRSKSNGQVGSGRRVAVTTQLLFDFEPACGSPDDPQPAKNPRRTKAAAGGRDGRVALHR